jgi:oxidase EvaA
VKDIYSLKERIGNLSQSQKTEQIGMKDATDWIYDGDSLSHKTGGYFSVIGLRSSSENSGLILDQRETGLIGLFVHKRQDEIYFLLQYRCEPGLFNGCNLTTTVQATPSNYLGSNRGKRTFGISTILHSTSKNRIIFDSFEYDYGAFFLGKIKRFVVVELDEFIKPPEGFEWIPESLMRLALYEDYMFSTDLRMMIGKYFSSLSFMGQPETNSKLVYSLHFEEKRGENKQTRIDSLRDVKVTDYGITQIAPDLTPVSEISLVRISSPTREITEWSQPLLRLNFVPVVSLLSAHFEGNTYSLCKWRFEPGINALPILGPTYVNYLDGPENEIYNHPKIIKKSEVLVSGEGARFMQTDFRIQVFEHLSNCKLEVPDGFIWIKDVEMQRIVSSSMSTSVELRYCLSLV